MLAAAGRALVATQLGRSLPLCSASPMRLTENSLPRHCAAGRAAPDDCSLCSCPSLSRDSGIGFSSGTLLRMEKRKPGHRCQMALMQRRHLDENCVNNPRTTYGLYFPRFTRECHKSWPWSKAATRPWHSEHWKE